jgi:hypothetical protein
MSLLDGALLFGIVIQQRCQPTGLRGGCGLRIVDEVDRGEMIVDGKRWVNLQRSGRTLASVEPRSGYLEQKGTQRDNISPLFFVSMAGKGRQRSQKTPSKSQCIRKRPVRAG